MDMWYVSCKSKSTGLLKSKMDEIIAVQLSTKYL